MSSYLKDNKNFLLLNKNIPAIFFFYVVSFRFFFSSSQWFFLWVSLELLTLSFIPIIYFKSKTAKAAENIIRYFLLQRTSSLVLVWRLFNLEVFNSTIVVSLKIIAVSSLLLKLALIPTHAWFPQISIYAKKPVFFLLLSLQKTQPFLIMFIIINPVNIIVIISIFISTIMRPILNIAQNNLKRLLVYSSISHRGWITAAIMYSLDNWCLYFSIYIITLMLIIVVITTHTQQLLPKKKNHLFFFGMLMFSLAGLPPLLGFFPKLMVIRNIIAIRSLVLVTALLIGSVVDFFIYTRATYGLFWQKKPMLIWENENRSWKSTQLLVIFLVPTFVVFFL